MAPHSLSAERPAREPAAAEQHVLVLLLHHIAGDGWSLGPLSRDLGGVLPGALRGAGTAARIRLRAGARGRAIADAAAAAAGLPSLPVQYADYTLWQRQVLGEESDAASALSRQLSYWTAALADLPEQIELPADRPRPAVSSHRGGGVAVAIGPDLHRGLAGLARQSGASLFMVLQAGLAGLLSRLGAGTDIAIGSPIAGRSDAALDDLVGFFVNTLVLRTDVSGNPSVSELIGRVRGSNLAAYAHAELPFERLVEVLNPARSLSRHPLFQVMLAFETETAGQAPGLELAGLGVTAQPLRIASAKFDLSVALRERRGADGTPAGIEGVLEYASDLFDEASIAALGQRLLRLLEGAVADPGRALGSIDILAPARARHHPAALERHHAFMIWRMPWGARSRSRPAMRLLAKGLLAKRPMTERAPPARPRPCRRCLPRRRSARRTPSPWCRESARSPTQRSMPTPTVWRIICRGSGWDLRPSSACASSARRRW